jgi:predicted amidohydrolase
LKRSLFFRDGREDGMLGLVLPLVLAYLAAPPPPGSAEAPPGEFTLAGDGFRIRIGSDGRWREIGDAASGEDRLAPGGGPVAVAVLEDGSRLDARAAAPIDGGLRISFGERGGDVDLRLSAFPEAAIFEVAGDPAPQVKVLEFLRAPVAIGGTAGSILVLARDERFAAAVLPGTMNVETRPERIDGGWLLAARAHRKFCFKGARAALVAGPSAGIRRRVDAAAVRLGLPSSGLDGVPAKDLEMSHRSYLFLLGAGEADADRAVAAARAGGFGAVMLVQTSWSRTTGHYLVDEGRFPGGLDGLRGFVDRLHRAGLLAGLHIWASKVSKNDPCATPVPDRRIWKDRRTRLAAAVGERAAEIAVEDDVRGWPGGSARRTYEGREADHCDLIIDDEIVRYERAGGADGKTFSGCRRGAYGTKAAPHEAGAEVLHPGIDGCIPGYIIGDDGLLAEVADRAAGIFDRCGFDMVYFDGGEDVPGDLWHHSSRFQVEVLRRIRKRPVLVQGTVITPYLWSAYARTNTVDIRTAEVKAHIDRSVAGLASCRASLIPGELGWFGLWPPSTSNPGLRLDEIEYLLGKSLAHGAPISIETSLASIEGHPLGGEILALVRTYEELRLRGTLPAAEVSPLLEKGAEAALIREGSGWRLVRVDPPVPVAAGAGGSGEGIASVGALDGGSVAVLSRAGGEGDLRIALPHDALRLEDFEGAGIGIAGGPAEAAIPLGPRRLTLRAAGIAPGDLAKALAAASFRKAPGRIIWIPAGRFAGIEGAMAHGRSAWVDDWEALAPPIVATGPAPAAGAPPGGDFAEYEVDVPAAGRWSLWARVRFPRGIDDSFRLAVEEEGKPGRPIVLGNCGKNGGKWHWTGTGSGLAIDPPGDPIVLRLPSGKVRLRIAPREGGGTAATNPRLDVLCLAEDPSFRPDDAAAREGLARAGAAPPPRSGSVRIAAVSQVWSPEGRALEAVLAKVREAAAESADLVLLPQECVLGEGEPIPGPTSEALAKEARERGMYIAACIRERGAGKTFVTSFLLDREGKIAGKYRKSHKLPDEDMDLGDDLPVFPTDFGPVAMRIGTDRHFPEVDLVYAAKGARVILWSQAPEPLEDEHIQDFPSAGRAADFNVAIACARYAPAGPGWITNFYPPYCGQPIGRAYVVDREGQRIASTGRHGGVATAAIPRAALAGPGRGPSGGRAFAAIAAPSAKLPDRSWAKRRVRVAAIEGHLGIDDLLARLDDAGRWKADIACTYEFVWIAGPDRDAIARGTEAAGKSLERIRAKAREHRMYVLVAGVVDRIERNEAILYDREGREAGRYSKIAKTHPEQVPGEEAPVLETDFGRIAVRICADEWMVDLDRCFAIGGADIVFTPTQSWGPDAIFRDLRDISRAMDGGYFLVECTHPSTEARHRTKVIDPAGTVVAASEHRRGGIVTAEIDLDAGRPLRFLRVCDPHKRGGYLPEFQPDKMPRASNDLREAILAARRPELYGARAPR